MNKKILNHYNESLRAFDDIKKELSNIEKISKYFLNKINNNKKIFVYGNGGSFSDSSHFVGELTASYEKKIEDQCLFLLSSNLAAVTAWSNDFKFEDYVKREFSGYVNKGDVLFLLSSSGGNIKNKQSTNLVKLAKCCKKKNIYLISLLGKGGGELKKYSNKYILVNSNNTGTIQEVHKMILHSICAYIDGTIK